MTTINSLSTRLHPADNVVVARSDILPGTEIPGENVRAAEHIPAGHKIATAPVASGEPLRKDDQIIGFASGAIAPGDHVHTHNVDMKDFTRDYAAGSEARDTAYVRAAERARFMGYKRAHGKVGTRNYIGVLSTVNCSATVARYVAERYGGHALADYPNVDGVVAISHGSGCGLDGGGEGMALLRRTLAGYARHPNFGGIIFVGLGCEVALLGQFVNNEGLEMGPLLQAMTIQDTGGTRATIEDACQRIDAMLPEVNKATRTEQPASELILGLECGGSDAYSGISANPSLGAAVDLLVRHGGTGVLGETPEIYGAEHLLTRRAVNGDVAGRLIERIKWWEDYVALHHGAMNNNPSPGNKAGGLTTILEKSLGAAAKGGTTNLVEVYGYAEPVTAKGFVFMDTPGYDPVSVTGMVAGGANMLCFTTGRGSVFGCKPVPCIKLATNTAMYERMAEDMDINCGPVVDGGATIADMGEHIFRMVLDIASGAPSKSEALGFGDDEFVPWQIGAVM
ncbi:MAG: altronate dehydratase family protein [Alphaproteobacteria bacterium]